MSNNEKQQEELVNQETEELRTEQEDNQIEEETALEEEAIVSELDTLKEEKQALEDKVLRLQAEIANIQRRNTRERQDSAKFRSQHLATELIEVLDNLERALEVETTTEEANAIKTGVEMVHKQFVQAFENEKIESINPLNEEFDPNFHQAVSIMPGEEGQASNTVINVLQKGYRIDNRVLRPAMVIVSE